jgi:hypothetical protein
MKQSGYAGQPSMQGGRMKVIAGGCFDGTCPTIYATDRGTVVVQGQQVNDNDVTLGPGEVLSRSRPTF